MPKWTPLSYRPDYDTSWEIAPGALNYCDGLIPTKRGSLATWKCETTVASYTSTTEPIAAGIVRASVGNTEFLVFNKQSIYDFDSTTTVDDVSGTTYSSSTVGWDFVAYGDYTIAVNYYNNPQIKAISVGGGINFADLGGSPPKAQCIVVALGQIMLGNYNDGTSHPAGWYVSDYDDATDWTITATNGADKGDLYDTPGPIRSLVMLRDSVIAYKDDSIYIGEFVGDPTRTIWAWRVISDKVGCGALHGVAVLNDIHYFFHRTGFYSFDGAAVRRLPGSPSNTQIDFLIAAGGINNNSSQTMVDQRDNLVLFCMAAVGSVKPDRVIVYNAETGEWSSIQGTVMTGHASAYPTATVQATYADLILFDSNMANDDFTTSLFIGPNGAGKIAAQYGLYPGTGTVSRDNYFGTGVIGNGDDMITVNRIKPRFASQQGFFSGTPTCQVYAGKSENTVEVETPVAFVWNSTEKCFDGHVTGRYIAVEIGFTDTSCEIGGLALLSPKPAGKR